MMQTRCHWASSEWRFYVSYIPQNYPRSVGEMFRTTTFSTNSCAALWKLKSVRSVNGEPLHGIGCIASDSTVELRPFTNHAAYVFVAILNNSAAATPLLAKGKSAKCIKKALLHQNDHRHCHHDYRHSHHAVVLSINCSPAPIAYG